MYLRWRTTSLCSQTEMELETIRSPARGRLLQSGGVSNHAPTPPIGDSLVRVHPITEGSIILSWCVGWGMRTCWSTPMFLNSGCHLKAHLGSCEKILIPRPTPYHLNQTPQECVLSSQVISAYRS